MSDRDIVNARIRQSAVRAAAGEPEALIEFCDLVFPIVTGIVCKHTRGLPKVDQQDIIQEVCLSILDKDSLLRVDDPVRWIPSVASNKVNDYFRRRRGKEPLTQSLSGGTDGTPAADRVQDTRQHWQDIYDEREAVRAFCDSLKPFDREILQLRQEGLNEQEIMNTIPCTEGTLKSSLRRIRAKYEERGIRARIRSKKEVNDATDSG